MEQTAARVADVAPTRPVRAGRLSVYVALTKTRLVMLVLFTTFTGFVVGSADSVAWARLSWTLLGTALTALGANALNQWLERARDGRMSRTCRRPLPMRHVSPHEACAAGGLLVVLGPALLAATVGWLPAALASVAALVYVCVYTPLKVRTPLCTLVGAISGALPPLIGCAAATGRLDSGAWILGGILFVWQMPHFMALGWLFREDYARGGFRVLPAIDRSGRRTGLVALLYALALLPAGLAATFAGLGGWFYAVAALLLGAAMVLLGADLYRARTRAGARRLFLASIVYLPFLLGCLLADRGPVLRTVPAVGDMHRNASAQVRPAAPGAPPADGSS